MFSPSDHTFAISAYGESPYLSACIESVLNQQTPTRVIIATSTPNSIIDRCARNYDVPLFVNSGTPDICSDWNRAVAHAHTPLVTVAHQDDIYCPEYSAHMLAAMNTAEKPLIFFSNYGELRNGIKVDSNTLLQIKRLLLSPLKRSGSASSVRAKRRILSLGSSICCPSVTLNTTALPKPPFQSRLKSNLDWDTWERYTHLEGSFLYDEKILMYHRVHEDSATSALIKDNTRTQEDLEMLERFWPTPFARIINLAYSIGQKSNG